MKLKKKIKIVLWKTKIVLGEYAKATRPVVLFLSFEFKYLKFKKFTTNIE